MLKGSPNLIDYPENNPSVKGMKPHRSFWKAMPSRALIYADSVENIGIVGEGTIDGNGKSPAFITEDDNPNRPKLIFIVNCKRVKVENLRFQNTAFWLQHYFACDGVYIKGLNIYNHGNKNVDGIDIDSKNVVIQDCIIDCDDDALCFKSDGNFLCENVVVTNCILSSNCNFIKMGTASYTGFKNISISNCVLKGTKESNIRNWSKMSRGISDSLTGLAGIALEIVDGGKMEKININNIIMSNVQTPIFIKLGSRMNPTGSIDNISISNIIATSHSLISNSITAAPGFSVTNVVLRDMQFIATEFITDFDLNTIIPENEKDYPENRMFGPVLPASGFYLRHVKNITLQNIQFNSSGKDNRPVFHIEDAENTNLLNCKINIPIKNQPVVNAINANGLTISNLYDTAPIPLLLLVSGKNSNGIRITNQEGKKNNYLLGSGLSKNIMIN